MIYKVTNRNTSGPGSLTAALEAEGPRVVVFEVSGNTDSRPYRALVIKNPYLTVAGQTAPSPGITLAGCELHLNAHDVLLQHIRVRVGDLTDLAARGPGGPTFCGSCATSCDSTASAPTATGYVVAGPAPTRRQPHRVGRQTDGDNDIWDFVLKPLQTPAEKP